MPFPLNLYLASIVAAFLAAAAATWLWRRWCVRHGIVDEPGHRKIHDSPIPLAGGLGVFTGILAPLAGALLLLMLERQASGAGVLGANATGWLEYGFNRRALQLAGIFAGALGMLAIGWWDDKHELRPLAKFAGQCAVALLVALCGVRITLFVPNPVFSYVVTVLWVLTLVNAFNFMDNMNGLCAGLGAIASWVFGVLAAAQGQYLVALLAFLAFGALVGYLPHNFPRARAFLGDSGSHLVGYLMAILAILPHFHTPENPNRAAVLMPLLVLAVPLLDLVMVVVIRWRLGKPFYLGDNNHLSHRLVRAGHSKTTAVLLIWLLAALFGGLAALL